MSELGEVEIVPARDVGELADLKPVAETIFGPGDRPAGWFERKLSREAVDPDLSVVATIAGRPYGYVLVGRPYAQTARTAGVGVAPELRGRGIGRALLETAGKRAKSAGFSALRSLAEPERQSFYEAAGFVVRRTNHSLLNFSTGDAREGAPPLDWDDLGDCIHEVCAWMKVAWHRTPQPSRFTLRVEDAAVAHVSVEGDAFLVQRLTVKPQRRNEANEILTRLLASLPAPKPVLLYGCNVVSSITQSLIGAGWSVAQTASVVECPL
jgi:predicted N-acetyltransferase YhbS